jgi:nicotinic acid mononucleotide adenylyltransferase
MTALAAGLRGSGSRVFVVATGAGAGIQEVLWRLPGCSSFLAGAAFPYDAGEVEDFLGLRPARFASEDTAIDLAHAAYLRALDVSAPHPRAIGLGLTASVASVEAHRGDHRVHVAVTTPETTLGCTLVLAKGAGQEARDVDGAAADELGLRALFHAATIAEEPGLVDWGARSRARFFARPYFRAGGRRDLESDLPADAALFPGAFDPPHEGHFAMASTARGHAAPAVFAVSATPPHKSAPSVGELLLRAKRLAGHDRLFTEGDPLYLDKARRFPGRTFLVGADALARMLDARWGAPVEPMLDEFTRLGTRMRVTGRRIAGGPYVSADEVIALVPERFRSIFEAVEGRWDLSSTEARERGSRCA